MEVMTEGTRVKFIRWRDREDEEFAGSEGTIMAVRFMPEGLQYDVQFDDSSPGWFDILYYDEIEEIKNVSIC